MYTSSFLVSSASASEIGGSSLIRLYSSPQNLSNVRPGQSVIFTCTTSGSQIIAWSSVHYVSESGLEIFFGSDNTVGLLKLSPNNASVANLTMVDGLVLESELHIMVSSKYARSTVTCLTTLNLWMQVSPLTWVRNIVCLFCYHYNIIILIINFLHWVNVCVLIICKH